MAAVAADLPLPGLRVLGCLGAAGRKATYAAEWAPEHARLPARIALQVVESASAPDLDAALAAYLALLPPRGGGSGPLRPLRHGVSPAGRWFVMSELFPHDFAELAGEGGPGDRTWLLLELARTLEALHARGVAHGNLKPSNVLWRPGPAGRGSVALADPRLEGAPPRPDEDVGAFEALARTLGAAREPAVRARLASLRRGDARAAPPPGPARERDRLEAAGWTVQGVLGRGASATVYRARKGEEERAVKVYRHPPVGACGPDRLGPLRTAHPGALALPLASLDLAGGTRCDVLELYPDTLRGAARGLPLEEALEALAQLAEAVDLLHGAGLVHRDVKPSNALARREEGRLQVALCDFELTVPAGTWCGAQPAGTPGYRPPEAAVGGPAAPSWDVWSLAATARVVLAAASGQEPAPPVPGTVPAAEPRHALSPIAHAALEACASEAPEDRPRAAALAAALRQEAAQISARRSAARREPDRLYRGLEPYGPEHRGLFFGREADVDRLVELLRRSRLLVVLGPSGIGKSSLLAAGLRPRLEEAGERGEPPWSVTLVKPGPGLVRTLESVSATGAPGLRPLVIVDQLEALLTVTATRQREQVLGALAALAGGRQDQGPCVVVGIREDFYGPLLAHAPFSAPGSHLAVRLGPLGEAGQIEALERPAARFGYRWEPGLAAWLVASVQGDAGALPLLQLAACELWDARDRDGLVLRRASLDRLGGVGGAIQRHTRALMAALTEDAALWEGQAVPRPERPRLLAEVVRLLLLRLVDADGRFSRPALREELLDQWAAGDRRDLAEQVLGRLVEARLLTASRSEGEGHHGPAGTTVELVHESLLAGWDELRQWIDEGRPGRRFLEELRARVSEWESSGRSASVLWTGAYLQARRDQMRRLGVPLAGVEARFWEASLLAERRRRRRSLAGRAAVAAAALAALAGLGAARWRMLAEARREEAGRDLARQAELLLRDDPLAGLARLEESLRTAPTREAETVARRYRDAASGLIGMHASATPVVALGLDPGGRFLLSINELGEVARWPIGGGPPERVMVCASGTEGLGFSPDGSAVWIRDRDGEVFRWPLEAGTLPAFSPGPDAPPLTVRPLPGGPRGTDPIQIADPRGRFVAEGHVTGLVRIRHLQAPPAQAPARTARIHRAGSGRGRAELEVGWLSLRLVRVPGARTRIGCSPGDAACRPMEEPREVEVEDFWMAETEVTQAQYTALMGENPSPYWDPEMPVTGVSLTDAVRYCERLRLASGLPVRLPTEAEWELAARAGSPAPYPWGPAAEEACRYGNVLDRTDGRAGHVACDDGEEETAQVARYLPNAFGLHDLIGNVRELVWPLSSSGAVIPARSALVVVAAMGGSAQEGEERFRVSDRRYFLPGSSHLDVGFRIAVPGELP